MTNSVFMRRSNDALFPKGSLWRPAPDEDLDSLLDGLADGDQKVFDDLGFLANIRSPSRCIIELIPDLEHEFGITTNTALSITDRRNNLALIRYKRKKLATPEKLQKALDKAGFGTGGYGLQVTANASPATDPSAIVDKAYQLVAHAVSDGTNSVAGNSLSYAGIRGGYYLVNGDNYMLSPLYPQSGLICARAFDGSDAKSGIQCAGYYSSYTEYANEHVSPPSGYWPLIFFVGGQVSRNGDGSIASISHVAIPAARRQELHRLILRIKPLGIWAAMIIQYT